MAVGTQPVMPGARISDPEVLCKRKCVSVWSRRAARIHICVPGEVHIKEVEVEPCLHDSCRDRDRVDEILDIVTVNPERPLSDESTPRRSPRTTNRYNQLGM